MAETREARFRRVAEARVNKLLKMLYLLGNCSCRSIYAYQLEEVNQLFDTLQLALCAARARFYLGKQRFTLSGTYQLKQEILRNPHVILHLPNGQHLHAVTFQQDDYPSVNVYLCRPDAEPELICFAEYNPEKTSGHEICIGTYQSDQEDTTYYAPYRAEEEYHE